MSVVSIQGYLYSARQLTVSANASAVNKGEEAGFPPQKVEFPILGSTIPDISPAQPPAKPDPKSFSISPYNSWKILLLYDEITARVGISFDCGSARGFRANTVADHDLCRAWTLCHLSMSTKVRSDGRI